jgi:dihydropteroate synthase
MGIVNLTPDSFSGGGAPAPTPEEARDIALRHVAEGARIIDFGAESTRPGSSPLDAGEELRRLGEVVRLTRKETSAPLSVDTYRVETARAVLDQGADIINDVTALKGFFSPDAKGDSGMAGLAAREKAQVVVMHAPAEPRIMRDAPRYGDAVAEVNAFLAARARFALAAGIARERIWLDPGFGFGKDFGDNRELLLRLDETAALGYPVLAGLSRKRMIADALGLPPHERLEASLALAVAAALRGAAIVRVHDVRATARAIGMINRLRDA